MASVFEYVIGYVLWAFFGVFGWHHLFFGRYAQAIAYGQTLGFFGLGWLLDIFSIHKYVQEGSSGRPARTHGRWHTVGTLFIVYTFGYLYGMLAEAMWTPIVDTRSIEPLSHRAGAYAIVSACVSAGAYVAARWREWDVDYLTGFTSACMWLAITESRQAMAEDELYTPENGEAEEKFSVPFLAACGAALALMLMRRVPKAEHTIAMPLEPTSARAAGNSVPVGGAPAPAAPTPQKAVATQRRATCCQGCLRTSGALFAQGTWAVAAVVALLLHSELPVDEMGKHDPAGLRTMKIGRYAWENRDHIRDQFKEVYVALQQYMQQRGFEGIREDIAREWFKSDAADYAALGLKEGASLGEVKSAHRKLVRAAHPDRLPAGTTDEQRHAAAERFRKIQGAYERLASKRGGRPSRDEAPEAGFRRRARRGA